MSSLIGMPGLSKKRLGGKTVSRRRHAGYAEKRGSQDSPRIRRPAGWPPMDGGENPFCNHPWDPERSPCFCDTAMLLEDAGPGSGVPLAY